MAKLFLVWPLRFAVPAIVLALMVVFIRFPLGSEPGHGMVRLSWRTVGERVRLCEKYTSAEIEKLPKHMRISTERCSQSLLPYRLRVWWNEREVVDKPVLPAGWRGDRPLFVNEEFSAQPGLYRLKVRFQPLEQSTDSATEPSKESPAEPDNSRQSQARADALRQATVYELERLVNLRAGRIVLVGLNEDQQKLFLLASRKGN